jgi:hypothetical protein
VKVDLPATLGGRVPRPARVVDLSLLGCLVRSEKPFARGAVVDLDVELPDGPLRVKARVAEVSIDGDSLPNARQHFLAGLEFLGLAALDGVRVRSFVDAEWRRRRGAHPAPS